MESVPVKYPPVQRDTCGTNAGYATHKYRDETSCEPCREANNEYQRAYKNPKSKAQRNAEYHANLESGE